MSVAPPPPAAAPRGPRPLAAPRVGVDIGRVIIAPVDPATGADTQFLSGDDATAMATPPSPGAFDALRELTARAGGAVWLVSKAGPRVQALTRRWLERWRFFAHTGVRPENLHFCRERRDKASYARSLGLTHFVDDRRDVLVAMRGLVPHLFLFGPQRGPAPPGLRHVLTWAEVRTALALADEGPCAAPPPAGLRRGERAALGGPAATDRSKRG
jgi:hypothetical protein